MAKRKKKAVKKRRPAARPPKKIVTVQSRTTTIGRAKRSSRKNAGYYMNRAKDQLYDELSRLMIRKEKASRKSDKRKITKLITEKRRQINKLK